MSSNSFHIMVETKTKGKFRMEVEHYYSSAQVERFKIKGKNDRYILMEKRLDLKRQPWKVTKVDINTSNYQEAAMALRDMQDAIDSYLNQKGNKKEP
ncbi:hypothetical protein IQ13_1389 [Lacibacter cauensis]|uniref:Uncharacterized protein n=1 Tax=Lacibacter cauensis TaxID=510947 RepID=A0A562SPS5_9BACT|nr:hypothetical protein [Lacibacter cauensis]TWI83281.1 hypothetical protein IQ13_1389 [Lacibacter cauensis]